MKWLFALFLLTLVFIAAATDSVFVPWMLAGIGCFFAIDRWLKGGS
jgi:hypothetical protein